jgi:capsular polysaccharide biosynthesis protein
MSEQALDLKRSLQIVRRHWHIVSVVAVLGLAAGGAYAVLHPPKLTSTALVRIVSPQSPSSASIAATLVVVASSDPVLTLALPHIQPRVSKRTLQSELAVKSLTTGIISIRAQGRTAARAENTANAVANGFVEYVKSPKSLSGPVRALLLQPASSATGRPQAVSVTIFAVIGVFLGAALGAIGVLAVSRRDRRLRQRDEIADSIGIPVLASIPVGHPSDAAGWARLLAGYKPAAVHAWSLRQALHHLALTDFRVGRGRSLAVLSLSSDPGALAIGPQLAVFAASLGIPTTLVIGPQQDANATAMLSAACSATSAVPSGRASLLRVTVGDQHNADKQPDALVVVVGVVDGRTPRVADTMRTTATVLGVSAGVATAEQLARVAVSAETDDRQIAGILVADPDSTDHTTGRLPQPTRMTARGAPTHLTGIPMETRRWMTQTRLP